MHQYDSIILVLDSFKKKGRLRWGENVNRTRIYTLIFYPSKKMKN